MNEQSERFRRMMAMEGATLELEVGRASVEPSVTFSQQALDELSLEMATWVGTRLIRRFDATQEPPTLLRVRLTVEVG